MARIITLALIILSLVAPARAAEFVDDSGRRVELPSSVARVLPAGPPAAAFLYAVAPQRMLGWAHEPGGRDRGYIARPYAALPAIGAITERGNDVDAAKLAELHPDLILDVGTVSRRYQELAESTQTKTGVPYVLLDGKIAALPGTLRGLGRILGAESRGEELASYAERTLAEARVRAGMVPSERRYRVYYGRGKDGLTTAGPGSIGAEFIELLGLVNVAPASERQMYQATAEQLTGWKPDVVVILGPEAAAAFAGDARFRDLPAVREGRVLGSPRLPFGWVDGPPSPSRLLALRWLGHALYPDQFPEDIRAATREFYQLFYAVDLSDRMLDELLK